MNRDREDWADFSTADYDDICVLLRDQCKARGWLYLNAGRDDEGYFYWRVQSDSGNTASIRPHGRKRKDVYWMCEALQEEFADMDKEEEPT